MPSVTIKLVLRINKIEIAKPCNRKHYTFNGSPSLEFLRLSTHNVELEIHSQNSDHNNQWRVEWN